MVPAGAPSSTEYSPMGPHLAELVPGRLHGIYRDPEQDVGAFRNLIDPEGVPGVDGRDRQQHESGEHDVVAGSDGKTTMTN